MTKRDREQAIADLTAEGWPLASIRSVLRSATTLTRLAELACSSEAADRDRLPCPATWGGTQYRHCLCDAPNGGHESIPRIAIQAARIERRLDILAQTHGARATFDGDPRGYVVKLHLPSGKSNTWGGKESGYGIG